MMLSKYKQRVLVLQALYMYEIHQRTLPLDSLLQFEWVEHYANTLEYANQLLQTVIMNLPEIDIIYAYLLDDKKNIDTLSAIDIAILRLAIAEMCFLHLASKIVISVAIDLSKKFSTEHSYKLINGILHSVMHEYHKDTTEHTI